MNNPVFTLSCQLNLHIRLLHESKWTRSGEAKSPNPPLKHNRYAAAEAIIIMIDTQLAGRPPQSNPLCKTKLASIHIWSSLTLLIEIICIMGLKFNIDNSFFIFWLDQLAPSYLHRRDMLSHSLSITLNLFENAYAVINYYHRIDKCLWLRLFKLI